MRIVTRPDFDGVVCAVLLQDVEPVTEATLWVEPSEMQQGRVAVRATDIVANLPFHPCARLWFDHHFSNRHDQPFQGAFDLSPSAAGLVHRYYAGRFSRDFGELVHQTDRIDAADLTREEVEHPERFAHVLLSMTVSGRRREDDAYWNRLVRLLASHELPAVMEDPEVRGRCREVENENRTYREHLLRHTRVRGPVAVTDFRGLPDTPRGNRFLVYSLFPETCVHMTIRHDDRDPAKMVVAVGHSIFNRCCRVNVGLLLAGFDGGGHPGAGSCTFPAAKVEAYVPVILATLMRNDPGEFPMPPR
jgi:hypothetical protein